MQTVSVKADHDPGSPRGRLRRTPVVLNGGRRGLLRRGRGRPGPGLRAPEPGGGCRRVGGRHAGSAPGTEAKARPDGGEAQVRVAVDTSVLLDVLGGDPVFGGASREALRRAYDRGPLCACGVVWAEVRAKLRSRGGGSSRRWTSSASSTWRRAAPRPRSRKPLAPVSPEPRTDSARGATAGPGRDRRVVAEFLRGGSRPVAGRRPPGARSGVLSELLQGPAPG